MKTVRIPCIVLLLLLFLSLTNSAAIGRRCGRWIDLVDAADSAVVQHEWRRADALLEQLEEDLTRSGLWLRVVLSHGGPDEAAALVGEARLLGSLRQTADMRHTLARLRDDMEQIVRGEQLSLANIL